MNRITTNGVKLSKGLFSTIQRHVTKWIEGQSSVLFLPRDADYSVHLESEGQRTSCRVRIHIGSREWTASSEAKSAQSAVIDALEHLHLTSLAA